MDTKLFLFVVSFFAACKQGPPAPSPATSSPAATSETTSAQERKNAGSPSVAKVQPPASPAPTPQPAPAVLLRTEGDLDGVPGSERVVLYGDGTLEDGRARGRADLTGADEYFMGQQAAIRVVELNTRLGVRAVLVALPTEQLADPPNRYQLFVPDGGDLRRVLDFTPGAYGPTELRFPGDGTVRYVEDGWTACHRAKQPPRPVTREEVTLSLDAAAAGTMRETSRTRTALKQRCDELAACPYVYIIRGNEAVFGGEILRHLRGTHEYGLQSLTLPAASGRVFEVRLAEEKLEVTHLDEIYLEIEGNRIAPQDCSGPAPPRYCTADEQSHLLRPGDVLDLRFDLPLNFSAAPVLYARGYYVPMPAAR